MNVSSTPARGRAISLALILAMFAALIAAPTPASSSDEMVDVIIRTVSGAAIASSIELLGGTVTGTMDAIDVVTATVPASQVGTLEDMPAIISVTQNSKVELSGEGWDRFEDITRRSSRRTTKEKTVTTSTTVVSNDDASTAGADNDTTANDTTAVSQTGNTKGNQTDDWVDTKKPTKPTTIKQAIGIIGADDARRAGLKGEGVTVALIDSGVTPVRYLKGRILNGPDLSFDSQIAELEYLDAYGHGTHMAGIITGIAPRASLLNVKVGAADGSVDVSQVLAAINWVIEHRDDNGMNVRVLNLSFGTDSTQAYTIDPLSYAVEVAWRNDIVVVVASGNDGNASRLRSPATNPLVLAVGAADTKGTKTTTDDRVADFSSCGVGRSVDVVAPGRSIASLRVKGSQADSKHPTAVVGQDFFRGSGTSQAAAMVSGAAAVIVGAHPEYTADQVKAALVSTASPIVGSAACQGSGMIDVGAAAITWTPNGDHVQDFAPSTGTGSLEAARGTDHLENEGVVLKGEMDIFGMAFDGSTWSGSTWSGSTWSGGLWNGSTWSGSTWSGSTWSGSTWSGSTWSGSTWSGSTWSDAYWTGSTWSGGTWSASTWTGNSWTGSNWTGLTWDHGKRSFQ